MYAYMSALVMRFARRSTHTMSLEVEQKVLQTTIAHVETRYFFSFFTAYLSI